MTSFLKQYVMYRCQNYVSFATFFAISSVLSLRPRDLFFVELTFAIIAPFSYLGCLTGSMFIAFYKKYI